MQILNGRYVSDAPASPESIGVGAITFEAVI